MFVFEYSLNIKNLLILLYSIAIWVALSVFYLAIRSAVHRIPVLFQTLYSNTTEITSEDQLNIKMVQVKVQEGWLEGEQLTTCTGDVKYYSFKGIPYAQPPVGKLRFKAPQPPQPWEGIRQAKQHGSNCFQVDIFTDEFVHGSEDCLYLNVYSPNLKPSKPFPVMFFIHGGGYRSGSGDCKHYGPDFLVESDVVLVTINYRLEAFGFLCLDTKDVPGNAGLKDQVAAMRWVQKNIAQFGGDPSNVTIFGESAGGASTAWHLLSPMSKGLFHRAIPMSGVPICDWSIAFEPVRRAFKLAQIFGYETEDKEKLLEFLQNLPAEKLVMTDPYVAAMEPVVNNLLKMYHFTPVVEKNLGQEFFFHGNLESALENGASADVDVLIGYTSQEGIIGIPKLKEGLLKQCNEYKDLFIPRMLLYRNPPKANAKLSDKIIKYYFGKKLINEQAMPEFIRYVNEIVFKYHTSVFLNKLGKRGNGRRYLYHFGCYSSRNIYGQLGSQYGIIGASHLDDLVYLLDPKYANLPIDKSSKEYELIKLACTIFTNFAKYGNPTPDSSLGVTWPEYNSTSQHYGDIGDKLAIESRPASDALKFWQNIYDDAGVNPFDLEIVQ